MSAAAEDKLIAEWRPAPHRSHLSDALRLAWVAAVSAFVLWQLTSVVRQAVGTPDWLLLAAAVWVLAVGGVLWLRHLRTTTARVELRPSGITLVTFRRPRVIEWADVARAEVEDVAFPILRGRGPTVVVELVDGSSVRLWGTENLQWDPDQRLDTLNDQANTIRAALRAHGEQARQSTSP